MQTTSDAPFPTRRDLMSLSVIPKEPPRSSRFFKPDSSSLRTTDIEKTSPQLRWQRFTSKRDGHQTSDIDGAMPRLSLASDVGLKGRPFDLALTTHDIDYARPARRGFKTGRITNPLVPDYTLPSTVLRAPEPPRFIRDSINCADIERTWPTEKRWHREPVRSALDVQDIDGARPDFLRTRSNFKYLSANQKERLDYKLLTKDITDPEERRLRIFLETQRPTLDEVEKSRPRPRAWDNGQPQYALLTHDILGALPARKIGPLDINVYGPPKRRGTAPADPHQTHDIQGASAGTRRNYIKTNRMTDPLDPKYPWGVRVTRS
ncbi:unnamed protein product [Vitrella brassicaformis CCMP3155]|uniref:Uncharacterized protein n=1 Tax=Vitrella brassicaformis (strain CCMP3155) TaxID=1169540 RepID=A0A0G4EHL1_VITBC|nr:unnamed protein product [Vitrella brassicaformis CCMP3155]|eukprot:CEL95670.1 unnamed protein product [Vitrella brassicaformis CCMP3155]